MAIKQKNIISDIFLTNVSYRIDYKLVFLWHEVCSVSAVPAVFFVRADFNYF